jgi:hypothetical protein
VTRRGRGAGVTIAGAVAVVVALAGCSSPTTSSAGSPTATPAPSSATAGVNAAGGRPCTDAAAALVAAVGRAVATYDTPNAASSPVPADSAGTVTAAPTSASTPSAAGASSSSGTPSSDPSADLDAAANAARTSISRYGCAVTSFRSDLETGLKAVPAQSPIAVAVLARLTASLTGTVAQQTTTRSVTPADDLGAVLPSLAPGSTVLLQAGTYTLSRTLVLLDGVTLRGSGHDATVIRSTAPDAAVVIVTAGRVEVSDLRLELDPGVPATGIVAGPQSSLVLSAVTVSGATATKAGLGGAGVQMSGQATDRPAGATTLQVTDSAFDHNAWAGIAVGGGHRASVLRASFTANGQCGMCFLDASSGSVQDSRFADNLVGLGANGTASPTWVGDTITGGTVGVQLDGTATPTIQGLTVTGASRAAAIFSGRAAGAVAQLTCTSVPYGIVVADTAAPTLGDTTCTVARGG